ncbi:MAG: helix-turn-helix domain-containing protein [Prevotella sp.]|nr:helix-turn-helix domain-containing protein [Candidatus Prevotella equi]
MASKKEIERLEKRIELLEMEIKQLKTVEPKAINERFKLIEETLYSTKDILNMKEVGQYLDISQSLLYKLTCNGEIPHFKPRGKMIFFEKKVLVEWIKQNPSYVSKETSDSHSIELNTADNNEEDLKEEQH